MISCPCIDLRLANKIIESSPADREHRSTVRLGEVREMVTSSLKQSVKKAVKVVRPSQNVAKNKKRNAKAKCEVCNKTFTRNFTLRQHKLSCKAEEILFKCDTCGVIYHKEEYLKRHKCTDQTGLTLLCDLCLVRGVHHMNTLSSGDISYTCDYCNVVNIFPVIK